MPVVDSTDLYASLFILFSFFQSPAMQARFCHKTDYGLAATLQTQRQQLEQQRSDLSPISCWILYSCHQWCYVVDMHHVLQARFCHNRQDRVWLRRFLTTDPAAAATAAADGQLALLDTLRARQPNLRRSFTVWNQRLGVRNDRHGSRVDYVLVGQGRMGRNSSSSSSGGSDGEIDAPALTPAPAAVGGVGAGGSSTSSGPAAAVNGGERLQGIASEQTLMLRTPIAGADRVAAAAGGGGGGAAAAAGVAGGGGAADGGADGFSLIDSVAWCEIMRDYMGSDHAPVRVRFRGIPQNMVMRETVDTPLVRDWGLEKGGGGREGGGGRGRRRWKWRGWGGGMRQGGNRRGVLGRWKWAGGWGAKEGQERDM